MDSFRDRLEAFFRGEMGFDGLQSTIDPQRMTAAERNEALATIQDAFAGGRLPSQLYQALNSRLGAEIGASNRPPRVTPTPPEADEATEWTIREAPDPTVQLQADDTKRIADPTLRIAPLEGMDAAASERSAPPSRQTGSNWGRPDQWRPTDSGPIQPGTVIKNRFTIEAELGKGGMGVVFKARDARKEEARDKDPYVAIKILNDELRNHPQSLVALQQEAVKAQSLAHPNIVTVYDFDRDGTTVYMTMELMRGESLSQRIRRQRHGGVPRAEAIPIILEMAAGLAYAHKRNIVHSDFKPGNVFLTEDNRVKVLDFGIARAVQHAGTPRSDETDFDATDLGALTPGFASLEMLNGEPAHAADDVYALAVTAYQLLSGEHPFKRRTAAEATAEGLKPRPIKGLKRREWKTISAGLQFRRADRIQDAGDFLRRFRGPTPIIKAAAAIIVGLVALSIYFAIPRDPQPLVPEENLPSEVRLDLLSNIDDGNFFLDNNQPGLAFMSFHSAYSLHPNNPRALRGLKSVAKMVIAEASSATSATERRAALEEIKTYSSNEYLAEHKALQDARMKLESNLGR